MNTITTTADLLHEAIVEAVKTYDLDVSDGFYAIEDIGGTLRSGHQQPDRIHSLQQHHHQGGLR